MFSTPKILRVPSVKRVLVPRKVRRTLNVVPSGRRRRRTRWPDRPEHG